MFWLESQATSNVSFMNTEPQSIPSDPAPTSAHKPEPKQSSVASNDSSRAPSFSSVKEDDQGTSQSFLVRPRSRTEPENAGSGDIADQLWAFETARTIFSELKPIDEDALSLQSLSRQSSRLDLPNAPSKTFLQRDNCLSYLEQLPTELLEQVLEHLALDIPPQELAPRNSDLTACLLASKTLCAATTNVLYRHITLPHSYVFSKFFNRLSACPDLGGLVRRFDLSHFSSLGFGRTKEMNSTIKNLTAGTLLGCLNLMPNLRELLLQEHLDQDIDESILRTAFFELPRLQSLDLCACYVGSFAEAFSSALTPLSSGLNVDIGLQNLSLHECFTIRSSDLELLLSHLPRLQILDLYHTRVTDQALRSIRSSAKLSHLNLGHCSNITGPEVTDFLLDHPAARELVYLNLSCDVSRYRLLRSDELDRLLPALPDTLRSLNLGGAQIDPSCHLMDLRRLSRHVEELGLGSTNLSIATVKTFFLPSKACDPLAGEFAPVLDETPCSLRFLDLTGNPDINQPSLFFDKSHNFSRIDAGTPSPTPFLFKDACLPLEVIELGKPVLDDLKNMKKTNKRFGWLVKEIGRRGWYVRERGSVAAGTEDPAGGRLRGERWWKMGCRSWGMKKVPVVRGHVGGLYGHCMFKK